MFPRGPYRRYSPDADRLIFRGMKLLVSGIVMVLIFTAIGLGGQGTLLSDNFPDMPTVVIAYVNYILMAIWTVLGVAGIIYIGIGVAMRFRR